MRPPRDEIDFHCVTVLCISNRATKELERQIKTFFFFKGNTLTVLSSKK